MSKKRRNSSPGAQRWREKQAFRYTMLAAVARDEIERQIKADEWRARKRGNK